MSPLDFLQAVWPAAGKYCIATPLPTGGFRHSVFETIVAAATHCEKIKSQESVYFAVHTLKDERIWTKNARINKATGLREDGWSVRTQANTQEAAAFFFDLDVGTSGKTAKYATQAAAIVALKQFVALTGLPRPMVVSSGYGVHVYWLLDRGVPSATEWLTYASQLRQLANHHLMLVDPSRTTDSASVLRVAGTFNHKNPAAPKAVAVLATGVRVTVEEWTAALDAATAAAKLAPPAPPTSKLLGSNMEVEFTGPPPTMRALLTACGQMRRLVTTKGICTEPEWWNGVIGVGKFTENGVANVHKMSRGHPDYGDAATDAKIVQWTRPPTSCEHLERISGVEHARICKGCPHRGSVAGPVMAARHLDKADPPTIEAIVDGAPVAVEIPDPPPPYKRRRDGGIEILTEDKEGKQFAVPIYPYDLYPIDRRVNTAQETEQQAWRVHLPHGITKDITIEASTFVDDRALRTRLANNGIYPPRFDSLKEYMNAYTRELVRTTPPNIQINNLGWIDDHTKFVLPTKILLPDGRTSPVTLGAVARDAETFVQKKGTLAEQVKLLDFFNRPEYVPNQFYIMAGLGSMLFFATGHHGVILNATGAPGASKSTALYTAAAFWGNPDIYVVNGTKDGATTHFRTTRMSMLSNLPFCLDELTRIAADVAKDFAMGVTQPGDRGRLNPDGTPKASNTKPKSTIAMTTANVSLHSLLAANNNAGTAASVRVFEIEFKRLGVNKPFEAEAYMRGLRTNYGHIGEVFAATVVKHVGAVTKRVIAVVEDLCKAADMQPDERFWFAEAAVTLVAAEIGQRLHLTPFDPAQLREWFLTHQVPTMRGTVKDESTGNLPLTLLTDYLENINGDIVKGQKPLDPRMPFNIDQKPMGRLMAHFDTDTRLMYVLKDGFRKFCEQRNQYSQTVLRELVSSGVVVGVDVKRVLGAGTTLAKGRSNCFTVNMAHPDIDANVHLKVVHSSTPTKLINNALKGP